LTNLFARAAFAAAALFVSQPVFAQTPAPPPPATAPESWTGAIFAIGAGGVTFTQHSGGLASGEVGMEAWHNTAISIEGGWMSSVVNKNSVDAAGAIATYLANTQGQPASATVKAPAGYGSVNLRYSFYNTPRYRVYALVGGGFGSVSPKTTFILGGTDVSGSIGQYGVTLGKDLSGTSTGGLLNVGVGAMMPFGRWFADVSYRFTPIFAAGETTPVSRVNFGLGRRF
jgi:hypothetical protein